MENIRNLILDICRVFKTNDSTKINEFMKKYKVIQRWWEAYLELPEELETNRINCICFKYQWDKIQFTLGMMLTSTFLNESIWFAYFNLNDEISFKNWDKVKI